MVAISRIKTMCPFCGKETIETLYFPPSIGSHTSSASSKSVTKLHSVPERNEIISGCPECGKSENEVKRALKEGVKESDIEKQKKRYQEIMKLREEMKRERENKDIS